MPRLALALALCACLLAGCGGDEKKKRAGRAVTLPAGKELRVVGKEYSFDPARVTVTGGAADLDVALDNRGALAHNPKVLRGEEARGGTPTFQGGMVRSGSVRLEPGSYRMVCTVGDHERLGMVGTLEVRAK